jgi:hypothetical protein
VNLAIHAGTVGLLWAFWREVLRHVEPTPGEYQRSPALGIAVGIFALNPVAVYAVAYLIQRSILMATFFTVLALWLFAMAVARRSWPLHAAAFLAYALGVLSKEYAILAPLAAIPVYILIARPPPWRIAAMGAAVAALAGGVAYLLVRQYGEILGKPFDEYSNVYLAQLAQLQPGADKHAFALSILNQSWLFFHYGVRWFLPVAEWMSINLRPPFPVTWGFPHVLGIVGYLSVLGGGAFLLLRYRDWRALVGLALCCRRCSSAPSLPPCGCRTRSCSIAATSGRSASRASRSWHCTATRRACCCRWRSSSAPSSCGRRSTE